MSVITERLGTMRRITDAAAGRNFTKSQRADFRDASRDVLDHAQDNLDAPAVEPRIGGQERRRQPARLR